MRRWDAYLYQFGIGKDPESLELAYNWEVTIPETGEPQGGTAEDCEFLKGNTEKVAPITFKKWGTYEVTGTVFGFCDTVSRTYESG